MQFRHIYNKILHSEIKLRIYIYLFILKIISFKSIINMFLFEKSIKYVQIYKIYVIYFKRKKKLTPHIFFQKNIAFSKRNASTFQDLLFKLSSV